MKVVYVVGNDPNIQSNDPLRFSLRSIEKHAAGVDEVYVVGYPPSWLSPCVKTLSVRDEHLGKHWNILNCIIRAIRTFHLDHDFLYSSDDHYLISDVDFDAFPYFCKGKLYSYYDYIEAKGKEPGKYQRAIIDTRRLLSENGYDITMACCHRNTHIDGRFVNEVEKLAFDHYGYSRYGFEPSCLFNAARQAVEPVRYTEITQQDDEKIRTVDDIIESVNRKKVFMSTTQGAEVNMRVMSWMRKNYNRKCRWEK